MEFLSQVGRGVSEEAGKQVKVQIGLYDKQGVIEELLTELAPAYFRWIGISKKINEKKLKNKCIWHL